MKSTLYEIYPNNPQTHKYTPQSQNIHKTEENKNINLIIS
jgi:hypothetical protein